jgi:anti-anti-sigma regulatory factor
MEENIKGIDWVLVPLADSVDILQKTLLGKIFVVNQLDRESYDKVRSSFSQDEGKNNFVVDISGVEFIFVLDE